MFQVAAFYRSPSDRVAFDQHYSTVHREIVSRLPGLRHATINWPKPTPDGGPAPYHLVTVMYWDDQESALAALAGPVGQEAAADAGSLPRADAFTTFAVSDPKVLFTSFSPGTEICGVLGLYEAPAEEDSFRTRYEETHSVLAAKMPRQTAFMVSWTIPAPDGAAPRYFLIGNQEWRTAEDFEFCIGSPEAAAAIADLDNFDFADGGMTMLTCRTLVVT
jgi:uncharacterized protein (TIGR02118 family)